MQQSARASRKLDQILNLVAASADPNSPPLLELRGVSCARDAGAVHDASLAIAPGTFTVLVGTPDSGHHQLLRLLGLLEAPESGEVLVAGEATSALASEARDELRARRFGFVFASPFLLPAFSVIENVAMPLFKISEVDAVEARKKTEALLEFVGLTDSGHFPCTELSPLEQQLAAVARALVNEPAVLLVEGLDSVLTDEPLVRATQLLRLACGRYSVAVVATASPEFAAQPEDRVVEIVEGRVRRDSILQAMPAAEPKLEP